MLKLTPKKFEQYLKSQTRLSQQISDLLKYAEKFPSLSDLIENLARIENEYEKDKADFVKAFNSYHGIQ
jgi:hypothetical protein